MRRSADHEAALAAIQPILERLDAILVGEQPGAAAYALLTYAVTMWRATGLPMQDMHGTLSLFIESSNTVAAAHAAKGN
jgi:hypothetical protein